MLDEHLTPWPIGTAQRKYLDRFELLPVARWEMLGPFTAMNGILPLSRALRYARGL